MGYAEFAAHPGLILIFVVLLFNHLDSFRVHLTYLDSDGIAEPIF